MSTASVSNLSPLKQAFLALERTQAKLEALESARTEPIAILGFGCRMPGGASTAADYWRLLADGVNAIREVPPDRWDLGEHYDPDPSAPGKIYTRYGGFLSNIRGFDADFFGISPREAMSLDPQQRMLLETSWEALESAALPADRLERSPTGVFVGISSFDYAGRLADQGWEKIDAYVGSGNCHSTAAGRLSYFFGFQGPCLALDTACSSSLVAVHLACQSLRDGECSLALAGGVSALIYPVLSINFAKARMLSADGRCKTFDAAADGYARGEGAGIVVLKRLSDALADGDPIMAVIRGSAVNQDGPSGGLTVPNGPAQEAVIRRALVMGKVEPEQVSFVEAHGTGTQLGDPIELGALKAVFGGERSAPLFVGSVKTNIGHLESAAGVAGLIKLVLMLQHGQIPPHLHFQTPNPKVPWQSMPIQVPTKLVPWETPASSRVAGLSSFGFSGTNAHLVVAEAPARGPTPAGADQLSPVANPTRPHVLCLSAKSEGALDQLCLRYAEMFEADPDLSLGRVSYTLAVGRSHFACRAAIVADTTADAAQLLRQVTDLIPGRKVFRSQFPSANGDDARAPAVMQAQAYISGAAPPEATTFPAEHRHKLHLPTYPFQLRDYWFEEKQRPSAAAEAVDKSSAALHPLLGVRQSQTESQTVFENGLPAEALRYLSDHRMGNIAYLPAAAYLELALAGAAQLLTRGGQESITIRDIELRKTLPLRDDQPLILQTVLSPNEQSCRFELFSTRPGVGNGDGRTLHATGMLGVAPPPDLLPQMSARMFSANGEGVPTEEIYENFRSRGLNYGPAFRALYRVHAGEGEVYCEVKLPESLRSDVASYLVHPVLLDACFQGLGTQLQKSDGRPFFLPVHIDRMLWLSPAQDRLCCHATIRPTNGSDTAIVADLDLFTPEGKPVALLQGIRFQQISADRAAANFVPASSNGVQAASPAAPFLGRERLLAQLRRASSSERRTMLLELLQQRLARVLRRDTAELPDPAANLFQMGMDSLLAVEFTYEVNRSLGIRLPVESLVIHSTLAELADELPKHLDAASGIDGGSGGSQSLAAPATPWIAHCRPKLNAALRLFCFHHLGGTASLYADWPDAFSDEIEVFPIQLPGREDRQDELPVTDFLELIETLSSELLEYVDRPFAFFGNSGGSLLAYELAQQLRRRFGLQPEMLFVGGLWAPHLVAEKTAGWIDMDAELLGQLGIAEPTLRGEESANHRDNGNVITAVAQQLAPHVRADFQLFSSYQYEPKPPLDCSITAFLGRDDGLVARPEILEWGRHTGSGFRLEMFAGGHTTWHHSRQAVVKAIIRDLPKDRGP